MQAQDRPTRAGPRAGEVHGARRAHRRRARAVGWTASSREYAFDPKTKKVADTKLAPPSPIDFSNIASEEVRVKSADGTMVPLSILHAKTVAKDGSHPTWLEGYGSYGFTTDPGFSPTRLAWLERNGVLAYCHVRGGGELGEGWHKDGMLLTKQQTRAITQRPDLFAAALIRVGVSNAVTPPSS